MLDIYKPIVVSLTAIVATAASLTTAVADTFLDPELYCSENECLKGPSILDPSLQAGAWKPFDSSEPIVWGADICLGYFLTKDLTVFSGGAISGGRENVHGIYVTLGDFVARVHIFDWPPAIEGSPYAEYGVFNCQNTGFPELTLDVNGQSEVKRWVNSQLRSEDGWDGNIGSWGPIENVEIRNDVLGITVEIRNWSGNAKISLGADYLGPPIIYDSNQFD